LAAAVAQQNQEQLSGDPSIRILLPVSQRVP
jgi:hypothetical protein